MRTGNAPRQSPVISIPTLSGISARDMFITLVRRRSWKIRPLSWPEYRTDFRSQSVLHARQRSPAFTGLSHVGTEIFQTPAATHTFAQTLRKPRTDAPISCHWQGRYFPTDMTLRVHIHADEPPTAMTNLPGIQENTEGDGTATCAFHIPGIGFELRMREKEHTTVYFGASDIQSSNPMSWNSTLSCQLSRYS